MTEEREYYQLLEINSNATPEEIKKAYKKLVIKWHPDKNPTNREEAEARSKKINEAFGVLDNKLERKKYDLYIGEKYKKEGENEEPIDLDYVKKVKELTEDYLQHVGIEEKEIIELNPHDNFLDEWNKKVNLFINKLSDGKVIENELKSDFANKCSKFLEKVDNFLEKKQFISDFLEVINKEMAKEPLVKKEFLSSNYCPLNNSKLSDKYSQVNLQNFEALIREICVDVESEKSELIDEFSNLLEEEIKKKRKEIISQSKNLVLLIQKKDWKKIEEFFEVGAEEQRALRKAVYETHREEIQTIMEEKSFLQAEEELEDLIHKILYLLNQKDDKKHKKNFDEILKKLNEYKNAEVDTAKNKAWQVNDQTILIELMNWIMKEWWLKREEMEDKLITCTQKSVEKENAGYLELKTTEKCWDIFQYRPIKKIGEVYEKKLKKWELKKEISPLLIDKLKLKKHNKEIEIIVGSEEINEETKKNLFFLRAEVKKRKLNFLTEILKIKDDFFDCRRKGDFTEAWKETQKLASQPRKEELEERLILALFWSWSKTEDELADQYRNDAQKWLKNYNSKKKQPPKSSVDSEPISPEKQVIITYLNNLIVEAAKNSQGDYSSLLSEKSIPKNTLNKTRNKVLRGEIDYSEEDLRLITDQKKVEKKRGQIVEAVFYYVGHLKGGSGQPNEAREVLNSFAKLLKEEILSKAKLLKKNIAWAELPSEYQDKLEIKDNTNAESLVEGKCDILRFLGESGSEKAVKEKSPVPLIKNKANNESTENKTVGPNSSMNDASRFTAAKVWIFSPTEAEQTEKIIEEWTKKLSTFMPKDSQKSPFLENSNQLKENFCKLIELLGNPNKSCRDWDIKFEGLVSSLKNDDIYPAILIGVKANALELTINNLNHYIVQAVMPKKTGSVQIQELASNYNLLGNINKETQVKLVTRYIFDFLIKEAANIEKEIQNLPNSWENKLLKVYREAETKLDELEKDKNVCNDPRYTNLAVLAKSRLRQLTYATLDTKAFAEGSDSYEQIVKKRVNLLKEKIKNIFPDHFSDREELKNLEDYLSEKIVPEGLKLFSFYLLAHEPTLKYEFLKSGEKFESKDRTYFQEGILRKGQKSPLLVELCYFPLIFQDNNDKTKKIFAQGRVILTEEKGGSPEKKEVSITESWERFFKLHQDKINTTTKKKAWIKSGLNPVESSPGRADSEADQAWRNGWTDLTINSSDNGVGEIKVISDGKVNYWSYKWYNEFDSLRQLVLNYQKDNLDRERFWFEFEKNFDGDLDSYIAEKWQQKGYSPLEAAKYSHNCWDVESEEVAAKNDPVHSGQAKYFNQWFDMNQSKLHYRKELIIAEFENQKNFPITKQEFESQLSTHLKTDKNWKEYLRTAENFNELNDRQRKIKQITDNYIKDKDKFFDEFMREINKNNIPKKKDIMAYYGKIISGQQAAKIYQAGITADMMGSGSLLNFKGTVYNPNDSNELDNFLQAKQLATEIAAENQKYDDILNRIKRASTEAAVEAETTNINNLNPNKLTVPRNIQTIKNIQMDRKNVLSPPQPKKPKKKPDNPPPQPKPDNNKQPPLKNPQPSPKLRKEYGDDYPNLKSIQQEGRKRACDNWEIKCKENYELKKICHYCPQEFSQDKSLKFLVSKKKSEQELNNHETNCLHKNDLGKSSQVKQITWEQIKKTTERYFYSCRSCWGKIVLDKSISEWNQTKNQALADLAYHEEKECSQSGTKKIAIHFSPNYGGNEHADLIYAKKINENELILERDNEGEIYQETKIDNNSTDKSYSPQIIGGSILLTIAVIISLIIISSLQKKKKNSYMGKLD